MARTARFTVTEPRRKPSHYIHRETGASWWRMEANSGLWYRMFRDGSCGEAMKAVEYSPATHPEEFDTRYGDLVITIQESPFALYLGGEFPEE